MKKTLIALAAVAAVSAASAQVTLSGGVRAAMQNSGVAGAETILSGNDTSVNNLTFTATEDIGGGMKITGAYTMRSNLMTGENSSGQDAATVAAGNANWRNTTIELSGNFGAVKAGRFGLSGLFAYDPFGATGTIATYASGATSGGRYNNMLQYSTPNMSGFDAVMGVSIDGSATNDDARWLYVNFNQGALSARVYTETGVADNVSATPVAAYTTSGAGVSYNLGVAKPMIGYSTAKLALTGVAVAEIYTVGATVPFGSSTAKFAYLRNATASTDTVAFGVDYALSKTSGLFADIAKLSANANPTWQIGIQKAF
jgi:predicted porin